MNQYNQFYDELCKMLSSDGPIDMLGWMAAHGQSVLLNWSEDDGQWECSWITGGKRLTAVRADIPDAIRDVLDKVRTYHLEHFDFANGTWRQL